jgi:hemoglobin-like flavoprotein
MSFKFFSCFKSTNTIAITNEAVDTDIIKVQEKIVKKYNIPLEIKVAHYTPSIFPLIPVINSNINKLCLQSWKIICNKRELLETGIEVTGITLFYNDFYERLHTMDENKKIESVLSAHSTGTNKIVEKGAIIIRIINYALSITKNDEETQFRLFNLGKAHANRSIRPYMYSVFIQTMLYTISNQLGIEATHEIMEAWVNVFAFIMKSMLPLAIRDRTIDTEVCINTKTEFSSDAIKFQIQEKKNESEMRQATARSNMSIHSKMNHSTFLSKGNSRSGTPHHVPNIMIIRRDDDDNVNYEGVPL